jgi:hypothetical protein
MTTLSTFGFPTTIHFGNGARALVADHLRARGIARPLIVTDRALARLPVLAEFRGPLNAGFTVEVFDGVFGNPTASQVMAGAAAFRSHGADAVIGFGGGAALDVAKAVALMAVHEGGVLDYAYDAQPAARPIAQPLPHFIALPTTAGTGSEVGRSSVISEDQTHLKRVIFSPALLAKAVFADPELTLDLPPAITAATGMDALTHNVESYLSPAYHPMCDGIALEGTRLAARALARAVRHPHDLDARGDMLMASMMGAVAFQKDLGAVHACAHALGAVAGLHHGLANALMIDTVLAWNLEAEPRKFDELAHAAGVGGGGRAFVPWLVRLKQEIGIAGGLAAHGVTRDQLPRLVQVAMADVAHRTNPRPVTEADFERLFLQAM